MWWLFQSGMRTKIQELGNAFVEMKTIEDIWKRLQEINEGLKFQYRIGQRDVLKWVLEEWPGKRHMYAVYVFFQESVQTDLTVEGLQ